MIDILEAIFGVLNLKNEEIFCLSQQLNKTNLIQKVIGIARNENSFFIKRDSFDIPAFLRQRS